MLPARIRVDVHAYDNTHLALIRQLPESAKILSLIQNGLDIPKEQFLVYPVFRFRDVRDLDSLRNLATAKEAFFDAVLTSDDTSFSAHPALDATEHRPEAQEIGEALGLCLMDAVYETTEQDWRRIPEGTGKTLDYVASDSERVLEVESKGSFVEDRHMKPPVVSNHRRDSLESLFTKSEDLSYTRRYIQFLEGMAWGMERTSATRNGRFWLLFWSRSQRGVRASIL